MHEFLDRSLSREAIDVRVAVLDCLEFWRRQILFNVLPMPVCALVECARLDKRVQMGTYMYPRFSR